MGMQIENKSKGSTERGNLNCVTHIRRLPPGSVVTFTNLSVREYCDAPTQSRTPTDDCTRSASLRDPLVSFSSPAYLLSGSAI